MLIRLASISIRAACGFGRLTDVAWTPPASPGCRAFCAMRLPSSPLPNLAVLNKRHFRANVESECVSSVTLLEIKQFLCLKCADFRETDAFLVLTLPRCDVLGQGDCGQADHRDLDGAFCTVFLNKVTAKFICPEECILGDWPQLKAFLDAWFKRRAAKRLVDQQPPRSLGQPLHLDSVLKPHHLCLWHQASPVESMPEEKVNAVLKHFRLKRGRLQDLTRLELRIWSPGGDAVISGQVRLLFPVRYPGTNTLVGLKSVSIDSESGKLLEENIPQGSSTPEDPNRLFPLPHGLDEFSRTDSADVILVSSIMDALALSPTDQCCVVTLAHGTVTLPPEHLSFLEKASRIIFWFPDDVTSCDAVKAFARKLGTKRCFTVSCELPQPSLSAVGLKLNLNEVLKHHLRPCSHESITTFESLRENVYLELAQFSEVEGVKWKRFTGLNDLIRGFRRGELTIFSGRTGTGKTTFMSEYSLDLCLQGISTLWGSFEVTNTRLVKMQLKQFSGLALEQHIDQFDSWANKFQKLPLYYLTFHGSQEVNKVMDAMAAAVYLFDIAHIIIDNIQFMMGSIVTGDRFQNQDLIIHQFRMFATLHNVHVTLVIHPRKEDHRERLTANSIFGGAKATQEADNVLLLQDEEVTPRITRKFIQVVKNRFSGDLGILPIFFNRGTLTFSKMIYQKERARKRLQQTESNQPQATSSVTSTADRVPSSAETDSENLL